MSISLTVGVLFRNNEELVAPFFYFLRKSTNISLKVIAVNQASTDNTMNELAKHMIAPHDIIVSPPKNVGISKGRNLILKAMKERNQGNYEHLLLLDSDVFIMQDKSIDKMYHELEFHNNNEDRVGIIEGKIHSWRNFTKTSWGICFCLINKKLFDVIGEFDENFRMFWDDTDFMDRMEQVGMCHFIMGVAVAMHFWGATTASGTEGGKIREAAVKNDKAYFEKKYPNKKLPNMS